MWAIAFRALSTLALLCISSLPGMTREADDGPTTKLLGIGDAAPPLVNTQWIRGGETTLDSTKIYVVEFWATWCRPCRENMRHLSSLARRYADQVSVLAIDVWEKSDYPDLNDEQLLAQSRRFALGMGSLMDYNVAKDDSRDTIAKAWLQAAAVNGIPAAFIVRDRIILWIGNPRDMDEALSSILAATYDLQVAIDHQRQDRSDAEQLQRLSDFAPLQDAIDQKDYATQLKIYEEAFALNPRLEVLSWGGLLDPLLHIDPQRACVYARDYVDKNAPRTGDLYTRSDWLNYVAGMILKADSASNMSVNLAVQFAQESLDVAPEKHASHYDFLAGAYAQKGDIATAIQIEKLAVSVAKKVPEFDPRRDANIKKYVSKLRELEGRRARRAA